MDKEEIQIEKLTDGESFLLWKFEFNIYVKAAKLSDVLSQEPNEQERKTEEFSTKDAKVQKIIINTIDKKLKSHILACQNAQEMYMKLCKIFEGQEERNKSSLLQKFFNYRQENKSLTQMITDIENLQFRLNQIGEKINEEMVMSKILTCLPNKLNYFVTAWESTSEDKKTLINLTNRLISEENRFETNKENKIENQLAFQAVKKGNLSIKCFKCNKQGHFKKDCKMCSICKKFNHQEKDCKFKVKQCSICKKTNHKEENCFFNKNKKPDNTFKKPDMAFFTKPEEELKNKEFIVDSGCTAHLNIDNQSAMKLIQTGSFSKRSKHIVVRYYFIHENYKKGNIVIKYCPTNLQIADMFTKPLCKEKFQFHCEKIVKEK